MAGNCLPRIVNLLVFWYMYTYVKNVVPELVMHCTLWNPKILTFNELEYLFKE